LAPTDYDVIDPSMSGNGLFYPSYCEEWLTWLVSNNPESTNYGSVHFLHCVPCQEGQGDGYSNYPIVVRIGPQALNINAGEYIFMPVLTSAAEPVDSGVPDNPTALLNYVRMDLEQGDNPPDPSQARIIDASPGIKGSLNPIVPDLTPYFVISDVFPLYVPPAQPGARLLRNCFDVPINTEGVRNCRVGGWWLLIRFKTANKVYFIHSFSRGRGQYLSGMFYQINVLGQSKRVTVGIPTTPPQDWSKSLVKNLAKNKHKNGEISTAHWNLIQKVL
jgi:hypothetical protein